MNPSCCGAVGKESGQSLAGYRGDGGYQALKKALGMAPDDVTKVVKDSGLRGRGGAGFPTGVKWTFLPKNNPGPVYLCVNADESEPGTFNNRILMEHDPHQFLEGITDRGPRDPLAHRLHLFAVRVRPLVSDARPGDSRVLREQYFGQEHSGDRFLARYLSASRGRGLHLRRRDGPAREPRREARLAADQAAVPRRRGTLPQADDRQQRRDARLRAAHPRARRRVVPLDRRSARSEQSARRREPRAKTLLHQRPCE